MSTAARDAVRRATAIGLDGLEDDVDDVTGSVPLELDRLVIASA
jgi:hypothetical protein